MTINRGYVAVLVLCGVALTGGVLPAAGQNDLSAVGVGFRYHHEHSVFTELPFAKDDLSYALAYEYHSEGAYWQIAVDYAPEANGDDGTGSNRTDYVITPQVNLIFKDQQWLGGIGILNSYVQDEDDSYDDGWAGIYWQMILGIRLPISRLRLDLQAYYLFESWGALGDFDFGDIDWGGWLSFPF